MKTLATARLSTLLADAHGRELLANTSGWLTHNGVGDSAAQELGLNGHSLKLRVETVTNTPQLLPDSFADRAQLWFVRRALEFEANSDSR